MSNAPERFDGVSVVTKANVFFDGKVVSHTIFLAGGAKKSLGLIYPGSFTFTTGAPEVMAIIAGACRWRLTGESAWKDCAAGSSFAVPGNSSFDIAVDGGIVEYVCSFG
jgi:uncharacterized protein YaiE (UPF0345 family)